MKKSILVIGFIILSTLVFSGCDDNKNKSEVSEVVVPIAMVGNIQSTKLEQ